MEERKRRYEGEKRVRVTREREAKREGGEILGGRGGGRGAGERRAAVGQS